MTKEKDPNVLEVLEYATEGPFVVETDDGSYTVVYNDDLVAPAPGQEDIQKEIDLVKLVRNAIDNAEKYIASRKEDKDKIFYPASIIVSFFGGVWLVVLVWLLHNNGFWARLGLGG